MKYIRTKEGIYKYADYLGIYNGKRYALMDDAQGNRITMCQEPEKLYRVANTIKELCDCFVFTDEGCEPEILFEDDLPIFPTEESQLYGAIWTDKGLIYVAKINDKGDLELL